MYITYILCEFLTLDFSIFDFSIFVFSIFGVSILDFSTLNLSFWVPCFLVSIFVFSIFGVSISDFSTLDLSVLGSVLLGFSGVQLTDKIFIKYFLPFPARTLLSDVVTSLYRLTHVFVCLSVCSSVRS